MDNLNDLVDQLSNLTLLEASQLAKLLREKWGIIDTVPPFLRSPNSIIEELEKVAEKEYFDVVLEEIGPRKIEVIKAVRNLTPLGLKEAKELVETPKAKICEGVNKTFADDVLKSLEAAGAKVALV